jgi:FAD/FMN-containing dehydrogenase
MEYRMNIRALQQSIQGEVLDKSSPGYEAVLAALLWNQFRSNRSPDVIVRVKQYQDVVQAVRFADANGLRVVARGGGHSWCGLAVRQGGMVIDLEGLSEVSVDRAARRAAIQPSISNRDLIAKLEPFGLAFPTGHCPEVKASGYLLSGGIGWNAGVWGHACHSVEAIDIVTAQGELVRADDSNNSELFWAARGGGASFPGIAVRYHLRLYPMPTHITTNTYYYPLESIKQVGDSANDIVEQLPRSVEFTVFTLTAPADLAPQCTTMNGKVGMITATAFADDAGEAANALAPLEQSPLNRECLARTVNQRTSFSQLFDLSGSMWPACLRARVESLWSKSSPGEILSSVRDHFITTPSPATVMLFALYPGWADGVPAGHDSAFSMCAKVYGGPWTMWEDAQGDAANSRWHDQTMMILRPFTVGHYLGETDIVEQPARAKESFAAANWQRLQRLRDKLDPKRLFQGFDGGLE